MVACANARVDPRAMMIITLNTSLTDVAVIAPRYGNNFALEAELIYFESFQKF